jgi:adenine-specific DNA-methyltransferase
VIHVEPDGIRRESTGVLVLPSDPEEPWSLPRRAEDSGLVTGMRALQTRLRDYGYTVSTGPLVWNRAAKVGRMHRDDARGRVPVVWSEAISQDGVFVGLRPRKKNHAAFYASKPNKDSNVVSKACILVQRTTAKEQHRRLISAILPQAAIDLAGGAVAVENHLNMILPVTPHPSVSMQELAGFLATETADHVLRCINASVAVSATELEALPLPAPGDLRAAMASDDPEAAIRCLYGIQEVHGQASPRKDRARRAPARSSSVAVH